MAAPTVLATAANPANSATSVATLSADATPNGLVLAILLVNASDFSSITDSRGNTWSPISSWADGTHFPNQYLYGTNQDVAQLVAGDTVTVTTTTTHGAGTSMAAIVDAPSYTSAVDKTAHVTGSTGTARNAGTTATTTNANDLILAQWGCHFASDAETGFTPASGYATLLPAPGYFNSVTAQNALEIEYQIVSATGAYNPTATGGASTSNYVGLTTALKQVASVPANTVAPAVSGSATVGATLSVTNGTWTNVPTAYSYQWTSAGTNIAGATSPTYDIQPGDVGHAIACKVVASNVAGDGTPAASSNSVTVAAAGAGASLRVLARRRR